MLVYLARRHSLGPSNMVRKFKSFEVIALAFAELPRRELLAVRRFQAGPGQAAEVDPEAEHDQGDGKGRRVVDRDQPEAVPPSRRFAFFLWTYSNPSSSVNLDFAPNRGEYTYPHG